MATIDPVPESSSTSTTTRSFVKVVIVGDSGSGKTSLMNRFCHLTPGTGTMVRSTVASDFVDKAVDVDGRAVSMQIWDTAGQERYLSLGTAFYRGANACILAFNLTNLDSFQNLEKWRDRFLSQTGIDDAEDFPFVVVGSKLDLANQGQRQVEESRARAWCAVRGAIPYFETSTEEGINVDNIFLAAARKVLDREQEALRVQSVPIIDLHQDSSPRKCC